MVEPVVCDGMAGLRDARDELRIAAGVQPSMKNVAFAS